MYVLINQLDVKGKKKRALVHIDYVQIIMEQDDGRADLLYGEYWANAEERFQAILNGLAKRKLILRPKETKPLASKKVKKNKSPTLLVLEPKQPDNQSKE